MTTKYTLPEAMQLLGVNKEWLITETGLSAGTIYRNLDYGSQGLKTHVTTAYVISQALGMDLEEIDWPRGLSTSGRHALDADPEVTITITMTFTTRSVVQPICLRCHLELPKSKVCGNCE